MAEMLFKVVDDLVLAVHSGRAPLSSEWASYVSEHERLAEQKRKVAILVLTAGGGPNSAQRAALKAAVPYDAKTAIVTRNVAVRGVVTAFHWLGWSNMKAYSPAEMDDALRFVGALEKKVLLAAELRRMQERLGQQGDETHPA